jgi:hypothetical protein
MAKLVFLTIVASALLLMIGAQEVTPPPVDLVTESMAPTSTFPETVLPSATIESSSEMNTTDLSAMHVTISQNGIDFLKDYALNLVLRNLTNLRLDDIHWDSNGFSGKVTDIRCENLNFGTVTASIDPDVGIRYNGNGLGVHCSAKWDYEFNSWPHLPFGDGSVLIKATNALVSMALEVQEDGRNRPIAFARDARVNIENLDIDFGGGLSAIVLNLIEGFISSDIKRNVANAVTSVLANLINFDLNDVIAKRNWFQNLDLPYPNNVSSFLYGLARNPILNTNFMEFPLQGYVDDFLNPLNFTDGLFPNLPGFDVANIFEDLQILLHKFLPQSLYNSFWKSGLLTYILSRGADGTKTTLSPLNTTDVVFAIPRVRSKYPAGHAVRTVVDPIGLLNVTNDPMLGPFFGVPLQLRFIPDFLENIPDGHVVVQCIASGKVNVGFEERGTSTFLVGNITFLDCPLQLFDNTLGGEIDLGKLQPIADMLLRDGWLQYINKFLDKGVPVPNLDGLTITNSTLRFFNDYVVIGSNFTTTVEE